MVYPDRHSVAVFLVLIAFVFAQGNPVSEEYAPVSAGCTVTEAILPAWLGAGFHLTSTEHFTVAHDDSACQSRYLADCLELALRHFYRYFGQYGFELHQPDTPLGWISFHAEPHFTHYARRADRMDLSGLGGYYSARTNRVAVFRSPNGVLPAAADSDVPVETEVSIAAIGNEQNRNQSIKIAHELAHQLAFNTGLQKRGVMYPLWVSEGLATQYETELSYCRNTNQARRERLLEMLAGDRLIPLEELVVLTRLPASQAMREDLYAQAWGFFNFLLVHRPEQLRHYLTTLYATEPGYREMSVLCDEFTAHFGQAPTLQQAWIDHLRTLLQ